MREIKFRAWDEQNKIMHYDFQFIRSGVEENDWIIFISDKQKLGERPSNNQTVCFHPFDNPYFQQQLKLMQYTGLKDKNGKEIYEGDIIKFQNNGLYDRKIKIGEIVWWEQELGWYAKCPKEKVNERDLDYSLEHIQSRHIYAGNIKVIGGIYENPELLQESQNAK